MKHTSSVLISQTRRHFIEKNVLQLEGLTLYNTSAKILKIN
jgi:hypothetical protein